MLSAETATGQHPIQSVSMMSQIASDIESDLDISNFNRNILESVSPVSYTHLRAHETPEHLESRLLG